jgi:hypothetical protein
MPKVIDVNASADAFETGASGAAGKWANKYLATTGMAAAAKSQEAQAAYVAKMSDPEILAKRQKRLQNLTDEDFKAKVRVAGASLYSTGVRGTKQKWAKNFAPIAAAINAAVASLPAKTADPMTNLTQRAGPVVMAAHEAAKGR